MINNQKIIRLDEDCARREVCYSFLFDGCHFHHGYNHGTECNNNFR